MKWQREYGREIILQSLITATAATAHLTTSALQRLDNLLTVKYRLKPPLFYKPAIWLPYFVIGQFLFLTVSVNIRLVSQNFRRLLLAPTLKVSPKSKFIFWAF